MKKSQYTITVSSCLLDSVIHELVNHKASTKHVNKREDNTVMLVETDNNDLTSILKLWKSIGFIQEYSALRA